MVSVYSVFTYMHFSVGQNFFVINDCLKQKFYITSKLTEELPGIGLRSLQINYYLVIILPTYLVCYGILSL